MQTAALYSAPRIGAAAATWGTLVFGALQFAALAACLAQLAIDASALNLSCALLILVSSSVTVQYLRITRAFNRVPLSSLALLGLCLTTQWGALVMQSACGNAVASNLRAPVHTFAVLASYQCVAILAHLMFRNLGATLSLRTTLARRVLAPLGVFSIPSPNALWLMGIAGTFTAYITASGFEHGTGDKALAAFNFLRTAPFLIPLLRQRYGGSYCDLKRHAPLLIAYLAATIVVGLATNARVLLFSGIIALGVVYLLFALHDPHPARPRIVFTLLALAAVGIVSMGAINDVATAMLVGRAYRDKNHTQWDVIDETIDALRHPEKLQAIRNKADIASVYSPYDEKYFDNQVLARVFETKFHDNMLYFSRGLRPEDVQRLREEVVDRIWATLPYPVLVWLKIPEVKRKLGYSMGDFWVDLRYGRGVGGFATGSLFADGTGLFGAWFAPVYLLLCVFLFTAWEVLSLPDGTGHSQIAVVALLMSVQLFQYGITAQALDAVLTPLRGLPQNIGFYLLVFWITQFIFPPFAGYHKNEAAVPRLAGAI